MAFKVNVRSDKYEGRILSITHNGYQWTSIGIHSDDEVLQIISALQQSVQRTAESDEPEFPIYYDSQGREHGEF